MREEQVGHLTRFVCHIGHVMTAEVLAASQLEVLENHVSAVLRGLNERAALCRDIAEKYRAAGQPETAETWGRAATDAQKREALLKKMGELSWQHPESEERHAEAMSEETGAEAAKEPAA
jgi:two-component system chemotaxis response regulator CheB